MAALKEVVFYYEDGTQTTVPSGENGSIPLAVFPVSKEGKEAGSALCLQIGETWVPVLNFNVYLATPEELAARSGKVPGPPAPEVIPPAPLPVGDDSPSGSCTTRNSMMSDILRIR